MVHDMVNVMSVLKQVHGSIKSLINCMSVCVSVYMFVCIYACMSVWLTDPPTNQTTPSWEANRRSAIEEIPSILWNLTMNFHAHKGPPIVPILTQMNLVYTLPPSSFFKIYFNIIISSK
jgi:hypothetical protein